MGVEVRWPNGHTQVASFSANDAGKYNVVVDDTPVVIDDTVEFNIEYSPDDGTQDWVFTWEVFSPGQREYDKIVFDLEGVPEQCLPGVSGLKVGDEGVHFPYPQWSGSGCWKYTMKWLDVPCVPQCQIPYTIEAGVSDYIAVSRENHNVKVTTCLQSIPQLGGE